MPALTRFSFVATAEWPKTLRYPLCTMTSVSAVLLISAAPALADCAPDSPGVVICSGTDEDGYANVPPDPVTVFVTSGATINNGGITLWGPGDGGVINNGTINGHLSGNVGGVLRSDLAIYASGHGNFSIDQNGAINQGIGVNNSSGTNTLIVRPGRTVNEVSMEGTDNYVDNFGGFNSSVTLTANGGRNVITNRVGASLNTIVLNGTDNLIDNGGMINQSITQVGAGTNHIINRAGATISGNINTTAGTSTDRIDNAGTINNGATLGDGNDYFVNRAGGTSGSPTTNGTIDMGAGNDFLIMADGTINGQILLGPGADVAAISGGRITSSVHAGDGNDYLLWSGGTISSGLYADDGNDSAIFSNLTSANLTPGLIIDGGTGNDRMAWQNTRNAGGMNVNTLVNWELIALARGSQLTFQYGNDELVLGDGGTLTGQLIIDDDTSSVIAGSPERHTVRAAVPGNRVQVSNAGLIDMVTNSTTERNRFVIMGDYIGNGGQLALQTYLGSDTDTRSDQLVIDGSSGGGSASGATDLRIINFGGPGAQTNANGILVVDAQSGATTNAGAFSLAGPVLAGMYEYQLFQGGLGPDANTDYDWYLRSSVILPTDPPVIPPDLTPITPTVPPVEPSIPTPPPPDPQPPEPPIPTDPTPITPEMPVLPPTPITPTVPVLPPVAPPTVVPPPPPPPPGGGVEVPLIRPEIPGYVVAPGLASELGLAGIDTFHNRRGDQPLVEDGAEYRRTWARLFGQAQYSSWTPNIDGLAYQMDPKFDGTLWGIQVGADLYGAYHDNGGQDRAGLFLSHSQAHGQVVANSLAQDQVGTGTVSMMSEGIGAYWTHFGEDDWYLDTVVMANWLHGDATSDRGIGAHISGYSLLGSAELGVPLTLSESWTLEPQAQLIVQHMQLDSAGDPFTSIDYSGVTSLTGRIGARLEADMDIGERPGQFFASADLWHRFGGESTTQFNNDIVRTSLGGTSLELQAGFNTAISDNASAFGAVRFEKAIDGRPDQALGANIGFKVTW